MVARKVLTLKQLQRVLAPGVGALRFSSARELVLGAGESIMPGVDVTDLVRSWPIEAVHTNVKRGDVVVVNVDTPAPPTMLAVAEGRARDRAAEKSKASERKREREELRAKLKATGIVVPWNATLEQMRVLAGTADDARTKAASLRARVAKVEAEAAKVDAPTLSPAAQTEDVLDG